MAKTTSIQLGDHFDSFIAKKLKSGTYRNASELIREGLRRLETDDVKLEALKAKLAKSDQDFEAGNFKVYKSASELNQSLSERLKAK